MNTEENSEITVEVLTNDDIMPLESLNHEIIDWNGEEARFYPATGAIMVFSEEHNRWIIRANRGGRPGFNGKEMVAARELKKEKAVLDGLEKAGWEMDLRGASAVLSAIVAARAKNAVDDEGRTGNADAKFIFSLVNQNNEDESESPSLRVDMDKETAAEFIDAMKEVMKERDSE